MNTIIKGKVFIAWSGRNDLAMRCKDKLIEQYECIVGGETDKNMFIGERVLAEIKECNQAIFIVQKKENGDISGNLLFELGYALSLLNEKKIYIFYIDIDSRDEKIPSDLHGIWAHYLKYASDEATSTEIIDLFLKKQKHIIDDDKIGIIDARYKLKAKLCSYLEHPHCSDYELAQYVLLYSHSAYMFNCEKEGLDDINELINNIKKPCQELYCSLLFSKNYLEFFASITSKDGVLYLDRSTFTAFRSYFEHYIQLAYSWVETDFTYWFMAVSYDVMNYMYWLRSEDPSIDAESKKRMVEKSIECGRKFFIYCEKLKCDEQAEQNEFCISLYEAYVHRNLALAYGYLSEKFDNEEAKVRKLEHQLTSLEKRKMLYMHYRVRSINSVLFDTIEMEYFLALSESLDCAADADEREDWISDCEEYIEKIHKLHEERNFFVDKIERVIRNA